MSASKVEISIPFDEKELEQAIEWARKQIKPLYAEEEWLPKDNMDFYCRNLCSQRENCQPEREDEEIDYV